MYFAFPQTIESFTLPGTNGAESLDLNSGYWIFSAEGAPCYMSFNQGLFDRRLNDVFIAEDTSIEEYIPMAETQRVQWRGNFSAFLHFRRVVFVSPFIDPAEPRMNLARVPKIEM